MMMTSKPAIAALSCLAFGSCAQGDFRGPDPLGPDHIPVGVRGNSAESHMDRELHLDHYREHSGHDEVPPVIKVGGVNASSSW